MDVGWVGLLLGILVKSNFWDGNGFVFKGMGGGKLLIILRKLYEKGKKFPLRINFIYVG